MKAEATLARDPAPSREALARSLAGNLCRCTGYVKVLDALETVAAVKRGELPAPTPGPAAGVGARADRYDGRDLVLGEFPFVRDMAVPGMLHGAVVLSAHPRAIVQADRHVGRRAGRRRRADRHLRGTSRASGTRA